jgi:multidrug efflux pump subunit AcrA (membrane-fusion protein)
MVRPVDHLYHVVDPSSLWIIGEVLESDVRLLAEGQQVEADFAALPGKGFRGKIDHMRLTMNPQTRTQEVVIAVDNSRRELRPGMSGHVRISVEVAKEAIVCPVDAIIRSRSGNYLLVERMPGKYENRKVNLGLTEKGLTEVLDGVFPGHHVVVVGNSLLAALLGNEHKARGQVVRISPLMHERMRVLPVWVEVANPDRRLKSGMLARIAILEHATADSDTRGAARLEPIESKR